MLQKQAGHLNVVGERKKMSSDMNPDLAPHYFVNIHIKGLGKEMCNIGTGGSGVSATNVTKTFPTQNCQFTYGQYECQT
jgi:hypothetical protein